MLDHIPTAETARLRLTFREMRKLVQSFSQAETAFHQAVDKLAQVQAAIAQTGLSAAQAQALIEDAVAKAVVAINGDAIWEERFKKLGDEVHFNGYGALETLVNEHRKSSEDRIQKMLIDTVALVDVKINHLAAAVVGKPPLPVLSPDATRGQKVTAWMTTTFARFRRWCIDAMPPLVFFGVVLLFILVLLLSAQIYFGHFPNR
jgi:hypothetical protein